MKGLFYRALRVVEDPELAGSGSSNNISRVDLFYIKRFSLAIFSIILISGLIFCGFNISVKSKTSTRYHIIDDIPTIRIGFSELRDAPVLDYIINGLANDEFQAALNDLPSTGGKIEAMSGNYEFAATIGRTIDNVIIQGQGESTLFSYDASHPIINAGNQSGWVFKDFKTDAGGIILPSSNYVLNNVTLGTTYYTYKNTIIGFFSTVSNDNLSTPNSISDAAEFTTVNAPTGRSATYLVAASDAPETVKSQADYICDGVADDVEIQAAIDSLTPIRTWKERITGIGTFNLANHVVLDSYLDLDFNQAVIHPQKGGTFEHDYFFALDESYIDINIGNVDGYWEDSSNSIVLKLDGLQYSHVYPIRAEKVGYIVQLLGTNRNTIRNIFDYIFGDTVLNGIKLSGATNPVCNNTFIKGTIYLAGSVTGVGIDFAKFCDNNQFIGLWEVTCPKDDSKQIAVIYNSADPNVDQDVYENHFNYLIIYCKGASKSIVMNTTHLGFRSYIRYRIDGTPPEIVCSYETSLYNIKTPNTIESQLPILNGGRLSGSTSVKYKAIPIGAMNWWTPDSFTNLDAIVSINWVTQWNSETKLGGIQLWNNDTHSEISKVEPGSIGWFTSIVDITSALKALKTSTNLVLMTKGDGSVAPTINISFIRFKIQY